MGAMTAEMGLLCAILAVLYTSPRFAFGYLMQAGLASFQRVAGNKLGWRNT